MAPMLTPRIVLLALALVLPFAAARAAEAPPLLDIYKTLHSHSELSHHGAKALLADYLYERFGRPDAIIGLHDSNGYAAGPVGRALPQLGRDPIVLSAQFIAQLQAIVRREEDPQDPVIVTVGSICGETKRNITPRRGPAAADHRLFLGEGPPGHPGRDPADGRGRGGLGRPAARACADRHPAGERVLTADL
jgi:metal-dependent amidase/aminoacylase/carboxypeptidase family protein